uniref:PGC-1 and ERR-induced regulator in muscle protein 1 n=1 Tax=Astyanax mexicanus TaxID=7994 RepID=A0A8B9HC77_ASTMX
MDDFEYSVQISEKDWDSFFRECEECNLLPPVLAGMEDSGMSDMDDIANRKAWMKPESRVSDPELPTHSPDEEESPMDLYLSRYGMSSPLQVLSGSEEDTQMETVNVFFERLKSVSASEDSSRQRHSSNVGREMTGDLKGFAEMPVVSQASEKNKSMQKESYYSHGFTKSTANELAVGAHVFTCPDTDKMVIKEKHGSAETRRRVSQETRLKSSLGKVLCSALANGKDLISQNQEEAKKDANSQLLIISDSDSKELLVCQGQASSITPRRRRKKKKRMCLESIEPDHGHVVQYHYKQSESDDDVFVRRKELDTEVCLLGDCSTGPGAKIDNILESFPIPQQSLSGNVMEPTVVCPNSPTTNSPSTLTAAQNKIRLDFMHEMSDLTGKQASAGQLAKPVNLMAIETGVPVKKAEPLMLPSDDSTSAPTNGDDVRSHSQLNSNLPSEIKAALKTSEDLPASFSTSDQIKAITMAAVNPESSENHLVLYSKEMNNVNEDCKSLMLQHTGNPEMNREALLALLPSNPAGISQPTLKFKSSDTTSQFEHNLTLSDSQCDKSGAAFQTKTSASDTISCVTFPVITETISETLSELHDNATMRQNLTCFSHESFSSEHKNVHEMLPGICDSALPRQSDPLNVEKAIIIPKESPKSGNVHDIQMKASQLYPSLDTVKDTGTKPKVKNSSKHAGMVNESENGRQSLHSKSEVWKEEFSKSLKLNGITDMPGCKKGDHLREVEISLLSPAAENRNEKTMKCQPLEQIAGLESQLKENSQSTTIIATSDEETGEANSLLSPCSIMEGNTSLIPESTVDVLSNINTNDLEEDCEVHYIPPHHPSKDLEALLNAAKKGVTSHTAKSIDGADQTLLNSISPRNEKVAPVIPHCSPLSPAMLGTASTLPESVGGIEQTSLNINTNCDEVKGNVHHVPHNVSSSHTEVSFSTAKKGMRSLIPESVNGAEQTSLTIITTNNEEKDKVQHATPQCPSKDPDVSINPIMEGRGSSIPVAIIEAEQTSLKIITTGDEEKGKLHHVPPSCPLKDPEVSPIAIIESTTSQVYESIGKVQQTSLNGNISVEEEKGKVLHVTPDFTSRVPEMSCIPKSISGEEHTSINVIATGKDDKWKVHHVPPHYPSKDTDVLLSPIMKSTASPFPVANSGAEQTTLNISTTGDVEEVPKVLLHCPSKDPGVSLQTIKNATVPPISAAEQISRDLITKDSLKDLDSSPSALMECPSSPITDTTDKGEHLSSHISITGEEKCGTHDVSQPSSSKYHELHLGAVKPDMECQVNGAKTPETLDNNKEHLHSQDEDCREQISPSLKSEDTTSLPVSGIGKDGEKVDCLFSASQDWRMEELSLKKMTKAGQPFIKITGPEIKLEDTEGNKCISGDDNDHELSSSAIMKSMESLPLPQGIEDVECTPTDSIIGVKEKLKVPSIPQQSKLEEHELFPSEIIEDIPSPLVATPSPTFDLVDEAKVMETSSAESQSLRPVYAISSFWNEMEKLTINDILRLRLVGQAQHPSVLLQPEDSGIADVSDAADSGYFTHLDDSKPDRSSGDMSYISDFDEELAQLQTQEAARLDEGSRDSPNSGSYMWENDLNPTGTGTGMEEMFMLNPETAISSPFYRDNAQQCFRKMCKNISVQNLQALETQPLRKILRNASLISLHSVHSTHSIHSEVEDDYIDPFDRVEASSPVYLSDEEEEMESPGITFSEIIQYLFGGDEPERCTSPAENIAASYLDGTGTSVPETYDHFFSEFEAGSIFNPLADDTSSSSNTELVPIFSCTRSANRNLQFPEVYDYFFLDDSPVHSDEDEEFDYTSIQVITRHDHMAAQSHNAVAEPDEYEDIPPQENSSWNFLRNNPLSLRRIRRTGFTAPPEDSSSWALTPVKHNGRSHQRGIQPINAIGPDERPFQDPLLLSLENRIFRQLANQQKIQQEIQTAVADPRLDAPLMPLKQADMCLVCIAFASWVLKSANPQGADMWKAGNLSPFVLSLVSYYLLKIQ